MKVLIHDVPEEHERPMLSEGDIGLISDLGHQSVVSRSLENSLEILRNEKVDVVLIHHYILNFEALERMRCVSPNLLYVGYSGGASLIAGTFGYGVYEEMSEKYDGIFLGRMRYIIPDIEERLAERATIAEHKT